MGSEPTRKMVKDRMAREKARTAVASDGFLSSVPGWFSSTLMRQHWMQVYRTTNTQVTISRIQVGIRTT